MTTLEPSPTPGTLVVTIDGVAIGQVQQRVWRWGIMPMGCAHTPTGNYETAEAAARAVLRAYNAELDRAALRLAMRRERIA